MKITDAQIHLWQGTDAPPHHVRAPFTIERALREMDEAGIDRAVNCPAIWDATSNDYAVDAALAHPERFRTMGWFPVDSQVEPNQVDAWMDKPGMLGLRFVLYAPQAGPMLQSGLLDALWQRADDREIPVALMVLPEHLPLLGEIARKFPRIRLMVDHLAIGPFEMLPEAAQHLASLLELAAHPNIAVKATGIVGVAPDAYPFRSTHGILRRTFEAFGADRMFWGTDISRQVAPWADCVSLFAEELPWLQGEELELVMGKGVSAWTRWV